MIESCGWRIVVILPASALVMMQSGLGGLDTDQQPCRTRSELTRHRGSEGTHPHLCGHDRGLGDVPGLDLVDDLLEHRGVAVDDPAGSVGVTLPGGVRDDDVLAVAQRRAGRDRLVVPAVHDSHLGSFAGDGVDPAVHRPGRNEDDRAEAEELGHPRHRPAVVAVGRCHQGEVGPLGRHCLTQPVEGRLGADSQPKVSHDRAVGRPGSSQDLE